MSNFGYFHFQASMFSLSEARILDNDANESNFMAVFNQLTRLNLDSGGGIGGRQLPILNQDQNLATLSNENPNPRMMTMGGKVARGKSLLELWVTTFLPE